MNPPETATPSKSPNTTQPESAGGDRASKNRVLRLLSISVVGLVNVCALSLVGISVLIGLFAGAAGIVLIIFIPITVIAVLLASAVDVLWLGSYLLRQHPGKRRAAAATGLVAVVAILISGGLYLYSILNAQTNIAKDQANGYQALLNKARAAGYGFDLKTPGWVPAGYVWAGGKIDTENGLDSTYFQVNYVQVLNNTDTGNSFSIITYSKRPSFDPPSNCGYYLGPYNTNNLPQDGPVPSRYPCALIGKTPSGNKLYYYYGQSVVTGDTDNYYVQDGNEVVILNTGPGTLTHSQAGKILSSLQRITMDQIAKRNASDNDY